ncbi:YMGG-like glycine zipper-containing protein [Halopiger xanaduensis]|uniref:17 kDa surface antigen n=1 Tax=Halopiger xanaduensis (strain DSM 18323 / JCM 14033 / SH-6) TaxID=797210 RepID=F8D7D0_HALXS|nr:YMGG-like glycine zipper-containing protein [Halopiger xanaduensis]AEH37847.1 17 kDa surface antigen [Halopiger xanaduensis SH-6]
MKAKITTVVRRARYAAIGAGIGAGIGALFSRNAASTGGAIGGLVGALVAETRDTAGEYVEKAKNRTADE